MVAKVTSSSGKHNPAPQVHIRHKNSAQIRQIHEMQKHIDRQVMINIYHVPIQIIFIAKQENDFDKVTADTAFINKLTSNKYDETTLQQIADKDYFLYLYHTNEFGYYNLVFWSTQVADPSGSISNLNGKSGFIQLPNVRKVI